MNKNLQDMANLAPKLKLEKDELNMYRGGLMLLASFVSKDFLDIPLLQEDRHATDGLFYSIPHLHDTTLGHVDRTRDIMVLWKVKNGASYCPYRFAIDYQDYNNYQLYLYDQTGERTVKHVFVEREGLDYYTKIKNFNNVTLLTLSDNL